jgi:hypothetical protein
MTRNLILFLLGLFFILNYESVFSQDSLRRKPEHMIGFEIQKTPNSHKWKSHTNTQMLYELPGYNAFYKFVLPTEKKWVTSFSIGFFYRKGFVSSDYSGLAGNEGISGDFEYEKLTLGIQRFKRFGKHKNFNFGSGFNYGREIYSKGVIISYDYHYGIYSTSSRDIRDILYKNYLSIHFEISQAFKLASKHYLVAGLKQYIETPDFYDARINLTSSLFLAYNLR